MKYCIDKDLAYRTPLCDDENVVLKDLIIFADDDHGVLVSIAPPILFITIMMVTMKVMIRISFRMFDDRVTVIFTSALLVSSASTMLVFQPAILKHYHTQGQSSIKCGVSRIFTFRDKKYRILTFCDKKYRILTFCDKTELYLTVLQQNNVEACLRCEASLSFVPSLPNAQLQLMPACDIGSI